MLKSSCSKFSVDRFECKKVAAEVIGLLQILQASTTTATADRILLNDNASFSLMDSDYRQS